MALEEPYWSGRARAECFKALQQQIGIGVDLGDASGPDITPPGFQSRDAAGDQNEDGKCGNHRRKRGLQA